MEKNDVDKTFCDTGLKPATRKVVEISGTLYVSIPRKFAQAFQIRAGDRLILVPGSPIRILPYGK
ncbi:MAG: AbrB/MazE/SpoVT family DNA-binding domain-containing protein [Thermodesulfobacteriota bacterium]